jgi:anaerobic selenocysteine-containing dehydrogenase
MLVEVEDGQLLRVMGDRDNPDSQGFLCVRGQASREIIGNPHRLLHPVMRSPRSGAWRQVSWDDALDQMAERMRAAGREAVGVWSGHGFFATNYGTRVNSHLLRRFANLYGCQWWNPTMICWGLGGFGLGITGVLETNTKEDMGQHANFVLLWGANLASQPNTSRHLAAAKRRGARVVAIDVRETEATAHADETVIIRPGTDAALALGLMHVIAGEQRHDPAFVREHTIGFDQLAAHVKEYTPAWTASVTGIPAEQVVALARAYAEARPAMIVVGGSSMHKGPNSWHAARAIGCLPALTGNLGIEGGGFGPRHGSSTHGQGLASIVAQERRPPGRYIANQMSSVLDALGDGRVRVLLLFGTDMVSSFAEAGRLAAGLARQDLVVSYELFMNDTAREFADIALPSTSWLEELGCKSTNTHLYLMPKVLDLPGEARPGAWVLQELARRLDLEAFYPWASPEGVLDTLLDHPSTGQATVAALRAEGGMRALKISHVAHPTLAFDTPSGKVEFVSERARALGLPALPVWEAPSTSPYPLTFQQGRTLAHFHSFFDHGRALPSLAKAEPEPMLWISPTDATAGGLVDGTAIRIYNERGEFGARAHVTARIPPGTVWMRDGWEGINRLTSGRAVLPDEAVDLFHFSAGQSAFDARVEVAPA